MSAFITPVDVCKTLDWIPVVSTVSSLVNVIAKYVIKVDPATDYGRYLHKKTLSVEIGQFIPLVNMYVQYSLDDGYRPISEAPHTVSSCVRMEQTRRFIRSPLPLISIDVDGAFVSYNASQEQSSLFEDEDILLKEEVVFENPVFGIRKTRHDKVILMQFSKSSGPLTCAEMMIWDKGMIPESGALNPQSGLINMILHQMSSCGLIAIITEVDPRTKKDLKAFLALLKSKIEMHGSAILFLSHKILGLCPVIIDEVSPTYESLRLRDPYHGWEITVKAEAKHISFDGPFIQAR